MKDLLILDTHIILWSVLETEEISESVKEKIIKAQENNNLAICSISLWEIAMLNLKKRISIFEPVKDFLASIANLNGLKILEITPEIAAESTLLIDNFHGDPADRIIVATTRVYGATLVTRDKKILDWAEGGNVRVVEV